MSSSKSSSSNTSPWRRLLEDKQAAFSKHGIDLPSPIKDEASFRLYFEKLGRAFKEKHYTKLLVQLQFGPINSFVSAVDALERFAPPDNLTALTSAAVYMAIKTACDAGVKLFRIVELLGELHFAVPPVGSGLSRFSHEASIHIPLYAIFSKYIDCLLFIISDIRLGQHSSDQDRFLRIENSIAEALQLFEREGKSFILTTKRASQNEANEPRHYTSSGSTYSSPPGDGDTARFQVGRLLGRGAEGEVHEVTEITTGAVYARKHVQTGGHFGGIFRTEEQVRNEVDIMRKLIHPHIASVLFWLKGPGSCSIFMEPSADCNLRGYLDKCCEDGHPPNALEIITPWFGCLLDALAFAHARKITHRDIKPANILVKNGQVFLADFGEAKDFSQLAMSMTSNYMMCGTPVYRAPEVTPGNPRGLPADVFSLGCVFSEMLTVCSRRSLTEYQEWRKVPEHEFQFMFRANLKKVREWINNLESQEELIDPLSYLIKLMLKEDTTMRSSAQQLWSWLVNVNSGIKLYCDYH